MKLQNIFLATVFGLALLAGPAHASTITTLSFSGTATGYDGSQLFFNTPQSFPNSTTFSATIAWDPNTFSPCNNAPYGCSWNLSAANNVVETLAINGHTLTFNVTGGSLQFNESGGNNQIGFYPTGSGFSLYNTFQDGTNFFGNPTNLSPALNFSNVALSSSSAGGSQNQTSFQLTTTKLTAATTTVPEPTTVALLGLGLLGVAASRRKSAKNKSA